MQRSTAPQRSRRTHRSPRRTRVSPYLLDEIAFTRAEIERARADAVTAA